MLHRDGVLYYFESFKEVSENVARGVICLDGAELTKLDSFNGRDFCVRVVSPLGRHAHKAAPSVWLLSFASQADANTWFDALMATASHGNRNRQQLRMAS